MSKLSDPTSCFWCPGRVFNGVCESCATVYGRRTIRLAPRRPVAAIIRFGGMLRAMRRVGELDPNRPSAASALFRVRVRIRRTA